MTFDKLSPSSLARAGPVLSALVIAAFLFAGQLSTVQQTSATTTLTGQEQDIIETQEGAIEHLSESDRDVNGIEFTPRWGAVSTLEPNTENVLFAECLEDEFAVSSIFFFESSDIIASSSFPVALPDDFMTWVAIVKNTDTDDARAASIGVICADENDGGGDRDINIDINTKNIIQNTIKQIIRVENNQVINLGDVINVYQEITQNAFQILRVTGNNNTVNQVISQSVAQIASQNATTPAQVDQIINQNARQEGVITGGQGGNVFDQTIDQDANQAANATGQGGNVFDQTIDQDANQAANATGQGGNVFDQTIDQDANQAANATGQGGGNIVDQAIDQGANQAANATGQGGGNIVDQAIDQGANQAANATGQGGGNIVDQLTGQNADQSTQVTNDEVE
jgi:hypothetical protein